MRRIIAALVALIALGWTSQALAWGDSGHRTVCEIAFRNLTPVAKAEVTRLLQAHPAILGANPLNAEYGWACTYPDHPAATGPAAAAPSISPIIRARPWPSPPRPAAARAPLCVISAIAADYAVLRSAGATDQARAARSGLSRPLVRRHPPAAAQLVRGRPGRQRDLLGRPVHLRPPFDLGHLHPASPRLARDPRSRTCARSPRTGARGSTDADRAAWLSALPWQWSAESYAVTLAPQTGYCVMVGGGLPIFRHPGDLRQRPAPAQRPDRRGLYGLGDADHPAPHHPGRRQARPSSEPGARSRLSHGAVTAAGDPRRGQRLFIGRRRGGRQRSRQR